MVESTGKIDKVNFVLSFLDPNGIEEQMDKFIKLWMFSNTFDVLWDREDPINPFNARSQKNLIILKILHKKTCGREE